MTAAEAERRSRTGTLITAIRWLLLVVVLAAAVIVLVRNWSEVGPALSAISGTAIVAALLAALASPILGLMGWRAVLADLGSPLHIGPASGIFFVGQLGKYVPGSVWSVVVQTELAARLGVPRRRTGVAGLLAMVLALLTGLVVGAAAVPNLLTGVRIPYAGSSPAAQAVIMGLLVVTLLVLVSPPVLNRLVALALRRLGREPLDHPLRAGALARMWGWFVLSWLSAGVLALILSAAVAPGVWVASPAALALATLSGFALTSSLAMLGVVLPAGFGLREALLVLLLSTLMPVAAATAVALVARFLTVIADLLWAAVGALWARRHGLWPSGSR